MSRGLRRALLVSLLVAACGQPIPSPTRSGPPAATAPAQTGAPPTLSTGAPPARTPAAVLVDPALLEVLPAAVDGVERRDDPTTAAEIASTVAVTTAAEAIAVALYIGGATPSAEVRDYAVVTVTRLRPGQLDAAFHRSWRDSFDAGVCDAAGGVQGNAEAEIAGHRTFIGTCAGGVRTYHVALEDGRTLVSMQALGPARLGERIVERLAQ